MKIKVAALYMPEIHVGEPEKNREKLERVIRDCFDKNPGIDLAVAPELANVGYHLIESEYYKQFGEQKGSWEIKQSEEGGKFVEHVSKNIIPSYLEIIPTGKTIKLLEKLAQKYNTHLVCGIGEIDESNLRYNSAVFIGPKGYEGTYRQHKEKAGVMVPWTNGYGADGQKKIFKMRKNSVDIGIAICAEMAIQEIANKIAPIVSLMAVPANWYEDNWGLFDAELNKFDKRYKVPLVLGNRGNELFLGKPHKCEHADPEESRGNCAVISIPGKKILKKSETIVEVVDI